MNLRSLALGALGAIALALPATGAHAATYISKLEYSQSGKQAPGQEFGTVKIQEINPNRVDITVEFTSLVDMIVDTGNSHVAFAFNLSDNPNSTVSNLSPGFTYQREGSYKNAPFGYFSNAITCCGNGASNGIAGALKFSVNNTSGITFIGPGNRFVSNSTGSIPNYNYTGGWWFSVDTYDAGRPSLANTFAVAARDFSEVVAVPEPATWAMMIIGFGAAGAVLRRQRAALA
jgi:hypothetical protein